MSNPFPPSANYYLDARNTMIVAALIGTVLIFFWVLGKIDRVVYLGPDPGQVPLDNQVQLKTEPVGNYLIERNAIYAAMKSGCRYDLNYAPEFGRNRGATTTRGRTKHIRGATLVDCP
jgi:hypothetical protein